MISLNQIGDKIAALLGDAKSYGVDTARSFKDFTKLSEYAPMQSLLPYQSYEPGRRLFLNDDSVGFGFELMPLTGCSEDEINRIVSMCNEKLPENADLHIQLISSNKIGDVLDRFYEARGIQNEINQELASKRKEYYKTRES